MSFWKKLRNMFNGKHRVELKLLNLLDAISDDLPKNSFEVTEFFDGNSERLIFDIPVNRGGAYLGVECDKSVSYSVDSILGGVGENPSMQILLKIYHKDYEILPVDESRSHINGLVFEVLGTLHKERISFEIISHSKDINEKQIASTLITLYRLCCSDSIENQTKAVVNTDTTNKVMFELSKLLK